MTQLIAIGDGANLDAFQRLRVSNPVTLFDSKQIHDNEPLFWDDVEASGGSTTSTHSAARASTTIGVGTAAGRRVRQTFQRFNYQPGKSQMVFMTFVLDKSGGGPGITRNIGIFDDNNGLFLQNKDGEHSVVVRTKVSGSVVDNDTPQSEWNIDRLDGKGSSHVRIDWAKTQILVIDYEWLGVGRVRWGFVIDGQVIYFHQDVHANVETSVYMSTPNLPLRFEIQNDGTGGASTLEHICATVMTEGGQQVTGMRRSRSTGGTHVVAAVGDTLYAILGIKLKAAYLDAAVLIEGISMLCESNDSFEWSLWFNPTITGTFTFADETNSAVQTAQSAQATPATLSGGLLIASGWVTTSGAINPILDDARRLGSTFSGTLDVIVLGARPKGTNANMQASINWREIR